MKKLTPLFLLASCTNPEPGIDYSVRDANHVAGTITDGDVELAFDFARDGERHTLAFTAADGQPLITTTLDGAWQTTSILGDRLVVTGISAAPDPTIVGDREAQSDLQARPEAALLDTLREELIAAGIDAELFEPTPPATAGVSPSSRGYYYFAPGDRRDWLSAAGASPTYIYLRPRETPFGCVGIFIEPWSATATTDYLLGRANQLSWKQKNWWGVIFTVFNAPWYASWPDGSICGPALVEIKVSPYVWAP